MKKIVLLFVFALYCCLLSSCQKDIDFTNSQPLSEEEMYKITYKYLHYSNGQYELLLSLEDAKKLGVLESTYKDMMEYLQAANIEVAKILMENPHVQFYDPSEAEDVIFEESPLLKTRAEGWDYVGLGSMPNQNPVSSSYYIPRGYSYVRVNVFSNALSGVGKVTLQTPYGTETLGTWNLLFWNRSATFQVPVHSGMNITVTVSVGSDCGGYYGVNFGY